MPSSISSSSHRAPDKPWWKIWIAVFILAVTILGGVEFLLRSANVTPSVDDTIDLWANYRAKVYRDEGVPAPVVIVGASRIALGFSHDTFQQRYPDRRLIDLSVLGACPLATLRDLAGDKEFDGIVIVSLIATCVSERAFERQQPYVDHYRQVWGASRRFDAAVSAFFQERVALLTGAEHVVNIAYDHFTPQSRFRPKLITVSADRRQEADFSRVNVKYIRQRLIRKKQKRTMRDPEKWLSTAQRLEKWVRAIQERGGKVAIVRFPTSEEGWALDEQLAPRQLYWDRLSLSSSALFLHFKDIAGADQFYLPDTSHFDRRDAPAFTSMLLEELERHEILPPSRVR